MALENLMKVNIDAIRASVDDIVNQEKGFTIEPSNKLVDMTVLNKYNNALKGTDLGDAFDTLKEIQEQIINTDYEYRLITTDKKDFLLFQRKRPADTDTAWETVGSQVAAGGDYSLAIDKKDGALHLINEITGVDDVVVLPGNMLAGKGKNSIIAGNNAIAISQGSIAIGENVIAGSKAFYIEAIDKTEKKIYLRTTGDIPTSAATQGSGTTYSSFAGTSGYEVGDEFSVANNDTHYGFCGTITAINGNIITYDNYIMAGTLDDTTLKPTKRFTTSDEFATIATTVKEADYWKEYLFWVPTKPDIGFSISNPNTKEEYFQGATVFGDNNKASANAAFAAGTDNVIGGKGANVLGTRNRGAYGNLISGGDNFSNGVHSMILGRYNTNLGEYNVLLNNLNQAARDTQYNLLSGYSNTINKGEGSFVGGKASSISGSCSIAFGNGVRSIGGYNALFGYNVKQYEEDTSNCTFGGGSEITYTGAGNIFGGRKHIIDGAMNATFGDTGIIKGSHNLSAGYNNQIIASYSIAAGLNNKITGDSTNNIVFGNDNTVSGTNNFVVNGKGYTEGTDARYSGNTVSGYSHFVSGTHNTVSGMWNFVTGFNNTVTKSHSYLLGRDLTCDTESQVVMGKQNQTDSGAALIIGKGGASNCLTVGASGTRPNVDTDAVTVKYLREEVGVSSIKEVVEELLLGGEW